MSELVEVKCAGGCGRVMGEFPKPRTITCAPCVVRERNVRETGLIEARPINRPSRHARRRAAGVSRSRAGR